ncbi:MAG TPA: EAL domain-containing protein [Dokdonella sp.]|uniref:GGDEF/EAL domain-containing response regulator n=1 Tax=Dokdonella sp. TaxID=2291710 RepID=UPI002D7FC369|nr:EAL domain-containing protein [Dokdonella sp.]HET9033287.1 EAL domain-containing protein [Dokdonella sp.]
MQASEPFSRRPRLRAAHVTQIPLRTADLRERGKRLCEMGWDINAALQLAEDAETLASTCRQLDDSTTAKRLESFAENLWVLLDPPVIPDAQMLAELSTRFDILDSERSDVDAAVAAQDDRQATLFGYAAAEDNGFPLLVRPPSRYWQRYASLPPASRLEPMPPPIVEVVAMPGGLELEQTLIDDVPLDVTEDTAPEFDLSMPPAPPAADQDDSADLTADTEPELIEGPRKACHLHDASELGVAIDLQLGMLGYELVHVDGIDALKEWLSRSTPSLVMLDGEHLPFIEEIGALVQSARTRTDQRVLLIAHGAGKSDLAARLRAMRAGCDACIVQPENAEAVIDRLRQLDIGSQTEPYRIMIVEDDRSQAFFAESILRKNGMQTLAVGEAVDVLDKLDEFDPDLILMDLNMPVCNGIELTALIREREAYISTPIVFLSGEGDTEKHFEALSAGGDDFLTKPIAPRHLITAVSSRVKRARLVARRRPTAAAKTTPNVHDVAQINTRLTEMLAMEDAATRPGGVLFIALECSDELRKRLGKSRFSVLIEKLIDILKNRLGKNDMLARSGEGEFLLLNPDRPTAALDVLARELREDVAKASFDLPANATEVAIAIGLCAFTQAVGDARAMIDVAERALLDPPSANEPVVSAVAKAADEEPVDPIVAAVRKGLADSAFRTVFQPIVSLHGEEEKQFQALLRLSTDDGRVYSATELVPAAESAGLIAEVDRWMLENCLDTIVEHLGAGENVRLFVNQSAASMRDPDRIDWMRHALESRRVPAAQLSLDLRMQDASANLAGTIGFALAMKQIGVNLTLSGVEAGDQVTDMLMHLPVDFIRLSPRYANDRNGDTSKELRDLVKLAHASGRKVIAPRVEEARVAASLWSCGIDLIQGNFVQEATRDATYDFQVAHA